MGAYGRLVVWLRLPILLGGIALGVWLGLHTSPASSEDSGLISMMPANSDALAAQQRAASLFTLPFAADAVVVQRDPAGLPVTEQAAVLRQAVATDRAARDGQGPAMIAIPVTNAGRVAPGSRESSTTALTYLGFPARTELADRVSLAQRYAQVTARRPGASLVGVTGAEPANLHEGRIIDDSLQRIEVGTVILILLVIGFMFRSLIAPVAVLSVAAISYLGGLAAQSWVASRSDVQQPDSLRPLMIALVLGIVTDYGIFYLSAARLRLRAGDARLTAARRATAEITPIVLASGAILALGLAALRISSVGFFRELGPSLAIAVLVAMVASAVLMPAIVAVAGRALFWPRRLDGSAAPAPVAPRRAARIAVRKPVALLIAGLCVAGLAVAGLNARHLRLGVTTISGLSSSTPERRAADAAAHGFAAGMIAPTQLLIEQPGVGSRATELAALEHRIAERPGVAAVFGPTLIRAGFGDDPTVSKDGNAARILVAFDSDPHASTAIGHYQDLEHSMPGLLAASGLPAARVSYIGDTALASETVQALRGDSLRIALIVILINVLLLMVFLRAILAPLLLVATGLLAVAATLGLATWILQDQLGHESVTYFVPFVAGVLLVSLGSDYNVFVTGRVWQEAERRPLADAVAVAAPSASRAIRAAGLVMAASFGMLALVPVLAFREFALIMVIGVLLETLLVRSLLVPALVAGFGYLSGWPGRKIRLGRRRVSEPEAVVERGPS